MELENTIERSMRHFLHCTWLSIRKNLEGKTIVYCFIATDYCFYSSFYCLFVSFKETKTFKDGRKSRWGGGGGGGGRGTHIPHGSKSALVLLDFYFRGR